MYYVDWMETTPPKFEATIAEDELETQSEDEECVMHIVVHL